MKHIRPMTVVDASAAGPGADLIFRVLGAVEGFKAANKFAQGEEFTRLSNSVFYLYFTGGGGGN